VLEPDEVRELVAGAAGGDRAAWERLVDEYSGLVWSVIRGCGLFGAEAADVSQTVWLRFVEHVDRLREAERAGAWLATTARHECFRVLRRSGRQLATGDVPEVPSPDETEHYVDALAAAEDRGAVVAAMAHLPSRCQQLLRMMTVEPALSYDEIAVLLDVPRGWIGPTRGRCLERLRRLLNASERGSGGGGGSGPEPERGIRHTASGSERVKEAEG
jgi:RNA polymerase sigma factor (sigma-70 family)